MKPWLKLENVSHRYGGILAVDRVSLEIAPGDTLAILGPNGAGKTTLGLIIGGMLQPVDGRVLIEDAQVSGRKAMIRRGVAIVPEGRRLFTQMSIKENLQLGGVGAGLAKDKVDRRLEEITEILPDTIRGDLSRPVSTLSGGEQQMVAIARAMMTDPKALIVDEPSMGLAPVMVDRIYAVLDRMHAAGVTILLIEQVAAEAMKRANKFAVMNRGRLDYIGENRNHARDALSATLAA